MVQAFKEMFSEFFSDNCMRMAAAISYYTTFALPAFLVVVISVASFFVSREDVTSLLNREVGTVVGANGVEQLQTMISHADEGGNGVWGTIIGALVLLFGATGVMVQLQDALNEVWDISSEQASGGVMGFITKRILSLGMILAFAFLLLVSLMLTSIVAGLGDQMDHWLPGSWGSEALSIGNVVISYGMVTVMFAVLYRFLPDKHVAWKDVWLGAAITGLLFTVAKWGLGMYLGSSDIASTYGGAGALALIMLWVYYSAIIFLLGAEFTEVWSRRHRLSEE